MEARKNVMNAIETVSHSTIVCCSEEDFKAAVRIRDHPWMQLYQRIQQARSARYDEVCNGFALLHSQRVNVRTWPRWQDACTSHMRLQPLRRIAVRPITVNSQAHASAGGRPIAKRAGREH
jgi:hypothetical protein